MKLGIIGLGRMGEAIAYRVTRTGHEVVGFDLNPESCKAAEKIGVTCVNNLEKLAQQVRIIWLMVPAGDPVDQTIDKLLPHLQPGDIVIDGGNSNYKNSMRRAKKLKEHGIYFLDCGTSGGLLGRDIGFSLMLGGDKKSFEKVELLLKAIAAPNGYGLMGPSGMGHYVKMVHNGIEYALLQAYAEGFNLIKQGTFKEVQPDLEKISRVWSNGSVIRSWILDLAHNVFKEDQELKDISGEVAEGGTGRWTVEEAHEQDIEVPLIEGALHERRRSRETGGNYMTKIIAMLRKQFGGHAVKKI